MDQAITQWINAMAGHSHAADTTMIWITQYGVPILVLLVATQWWSHRERLHVRHTCIAAGLSFLIGLGVNQIILVFVHRVRPYEVGLTHLIISPSADGSFPSDHATATLAIASTFLLCRLPRLGSAFLAGAFLICFSRIYVGTHYFTDVLGGAATGLFAAAAVNGLYREGTQIDRLITGIL